MSGQDKTTAAGGAGARPAQSGQDAQGGQGGHRGAAERPVKVGIIGCGNISGIYLQNGGSRFRDLEIVALADQVTERAASRAKEFGIPAVLTVDQLLADPDIQVVLNLTIPAAHQAVNQAILQAGKHAYGEKPLAATLEGGRALVDLATRQGLLLGCAPDTFLGAGIQTCRKLIDDGWIGQVCGGSAFMVCGGHEGWHPDPAFYYQAGGGPLFDMGPYYLTALVSLLGPVARVSGAVRTCQAERLVTSPARYGQRIPVEVPTHVTALLEFRDGPLVNLTTSFDVPGGSTSPAIELWGSEGSLQVPDPNCFGGPVRYRRKGAADWQDLPLLFGHAENSRGLGLSLLARSLSGRDIHRATGNLALHVLELMEAIHQSARLGQAVAAVHTCERPPALPA